MNELRSVPPLRIAVLGDFDGIHTRRWLEVFVQRGHDVHAISFYRPAAEMPGVTVHVLREGRSSTSAKAPSQNRRIAGLAQRVVPRTLQRVLHARRYMRAGLQRVLDQIKPDVFHAHYAVEHGFYGSFAGYHPYVVSTWGSDLLVESRRLLGSLIAKRALSKADLVTANDISLARRAIELGVPEDRVEVVHLGIDRIFLEAGEHSVNLRPPDGAERVIVSDRALEPLYNLDMVLRAFVQAREQIPAARLVVAGDGSLRAHLEALARELGFGSAVEFIGRQSPERLAMLLATAHVYVSVPSSDSLALSTVEAMAAGAFPVLSDLPGNEGWVEDGRNGLVVPPSDSGALAAALVRASTDDALRHNAVAPNREQVLARGLRERTMLLMERHYYRLAGHPQTGGGEAI